MLAPTPSESFGSPQTNSEEVASLVDQASPTPRSFGGRAEEEIGRETVRTARTVGTPWPKRQQRLGAEQGRKRNKRP